MFLTHIEIRGYYATHLHSQYMGPANVTHIHLPGDDVSSLVLNEILQERRQSAQHTAFMISYPDPVIHSC